jgi:hypothetical protein
MLSERETRWIRYIALLFGLLACGSASHAETLPCNQQAEPSVNCICDLRSLRPLQGAVGMGEVLEKRAKIEKKPEKEKRRLAADPIKVVRGPDGGLFVTDHHHGALAWLMAGISDGVCSIEADTLSTEPGKFWAQLRERHKVRLADNNGATITPDFLPKTLMRLPDDPYRTLAWMVRKNGGFCRQLMDHKEFAEFVWADWMRGRTELPPDQVRSSPANMLSAALKLAESPAAAGLQGYLGDNKRCEDEE